MCLTKESYQMMSEITAEEAPTSVEMIFLHLFPIMFLTFPALNDHCHSGRILSFQQKKKEKSLAPTKKLRMKTTTKNSL